MGRLAAYQGSATEAAGEYAMSACGGPSWLWITFWTEYQVVIVLNPDFVTQAQEVLGLGPAFVVYPLVNSLPPNAQNIS